MIDGFLAGLINTLTPENLLFVLIGCLLGTVVGVLPGLGPASTLAILLPLTFILPATGSLIMLAGIYYGAMYGGSTTSILLNMPGEAASVPTTIDGFEMTKQGRAGQALAIAAIGSFMAGIFGAIVISVLGQPLAMFGLSFGPVEYCALILFGMASIITFSGASLIKGLLSGSLGILLATVGLDPLTGTPRLSFGSLDLMMGFDLVAVLIGLFGISEVLSSVNERRAKIYDGKLDAWWRLVPRGRELRSGLLASARGTLIGYVLGLIPGMLAAVTTFIAYDFEKRVSKTPQRFGRGAIEGVAAPEAANNATAMAGFVPLLALGIPAGPSLAIMLAALLVLGITPGPALFETNGLLVWTVIASMFVANLVLLVLNLPLIKVWAKISQIPYKVLGPIILCMAIIGAFASRNSMFDVLTAVAFGFVGLLMKRTGIPVTPLILGLLLGPLFEQALRQSLAISGGSLGIFATHPIALSFIVVSIAFVVFSLVGRTRAAKAGKIKDLAQSEWEG